jgi:hypothetical protein
MAMTLTIEIPDDSAARYRKVAQARGLSVERWMLELADSAAAPTPSEPITVKPLQTAADIVRSHMGKVPPEIMATMPTDGASQHDHYIYGWPKKPE